MMKSPVLKSPRLLLRPPTSNDADAIIAACSKWEVSQNLERVPYPYPNNGALDWLERQSKGLVGINMAIDYQDQFIGIVSVKPSTEKSVGVFAPAIGYWLDSPFWGKGYMKEALSRLLDWYMPWEPTERMRAAVFEDNPRSLNLLQKLGFCEIGRGKGFSTARGHDVPQIEMELTADRYLERIGA